MRAMLWKELRENFKWAVLAMIGLGLAEFYGLTQQNSYSYEDQMATLCKSSFLMATTFGCAAVGLVLGLIQILPEQRRDQWAALLHRPAPRTTIYAGKALAGFMLYLFATIPPFLAVVWYVAAPGHFAVPFVPEMVWPGVADICAGSMYYFAALFVGLRRGAWYGTRAFGFLAAVSVSFFVTSSYYGYVCPPIMAALLMAALLFAAGWGAILTNGKLVDQPWWSRLAVFGVVFYGVCCAGTLTLSVCNMFSSQDYSYPAHYEVDVDGRVLKFAPSKKAGTTVTDLGGNVIHDKRFTSGSSYNYLLGFSKITGIIGDLPKKDAGGTKYAFGYRNNTSYVAYAEGSYEGDVERWYYLPFSRKYVGYFYKIKQRIGAIGQNGFRPGDEPVEALPPMFAGYSSQVQPFNQLGSTAYYNSFDQRKLTTLFSEPGVSVFGVSSLRSYQDQNLDLEWAGVALADKILVVDKTGKTIVSLPYHQNIERWGSLWIGVMPKKDRFFLWYQPNDRIPYTERQKWPTYMEEMDLQGNLLNTYTLPPVEEVSGTRSWQQYIAGSLRTSVLYIGGLAVDKIGAAYGLDFFSRSADYEFGSGWWNTKELVIRVCVSSFIFAAITLIWTRWMRFSWRRTWLWVMTVLGFNLAGLLALRLVADWPVRVKCPSCGRKREVEETTCPHCHAGWVIEKPNGMEIFEEKLVVQTVS